jgi:hypothetical protein
MTGKLAFKSLDGLIKGHIELEAPDWGALVEAAEARVMRSSVAGQWALFKEDGEQIKTGRFQRGIWKIVDTRK